MQPFSWRGLWIPLLSPWEVVLRAALVYLFVLLVFRLVGRKELRRYSTFEVAVLFLVTVALRRSIVRSDESLTTAFLALTTIFGVNSLVSYIAFRSRTFANLVEGLPRQLVKDGRPIDRALRRSRIARDELVAALRMHGRESLDEVKAAFLERDGRITFVFSDAKEP